MSEQPKDGGPAFPDPVRAVGQGAGPPGMGPSDWFAGLATDADVAEYQEYSCELAGFRYTRAEAKYRYADAIVEARK